MVFILPSLKARVGVGIVNWTAYDLREPCKIMAIVRGNAFEIINYLLFHQHIIEGLVCFSTNQENDHSAVFVHFVRQKDLDHCLRRVKIVMAT